MIRLIDSLSAKRPASTSSHPAVTMRVRGPLSDNPFIASLNECSVRSQSFGSFEYIITSLMLLTIGQSLLHVKTHTAFSEERGYLYLFGGVGHLDSPTINVIPRPAKKVAASAMYSDDFHPLLFIDGLSVAHQTLTHAHTTNTNQNILPQTIYSLPFMSWLALS